MNGIMMGQKFICSKGGMFGPNVMSPGLKSRIQRKMTSQCRRGELGTPPFMFVCVGVCVWCVHACVHAYASKHSMYVPMWVGGWFCACTYLHVYVPACVPSVPDNNGGRHRPSLYLTNASEAKW